MGSAGGQGPAGDAWCGLVDLPVGGLLGAMVGSAPWGEVALLRGAVGPRERVVEVGVDRLGLAARSVARRAAGTDKVPELAARGVLTFGLGVIAGACGDRGEGEVQAANELG